ncbi:MAG: YIP1 family protein [Acidobacteria bacterium]|nr:YIP1 family protein [Acidobacteriota bacterium]
MNPEMNLPPQPAVAATETAPQNIFSRLIGVWFTPGETFAEIGRAPRVLVPLLVLMVIGCLGGYLMIERIGVRNFFNKNFEPAVASGRMSQEEADKQLEVMTSGIAGTITKASFPVIGLIQYPIIALILVGVCKLITMLSAGDNRFKSLFSVTIYTLLSVGVITTVLLVLVLYLKAPEDIDPNNLLGSNLAAILALAFDKDGLPKFIMGLARWIDVFAIWMIALLSIGYAAVSRGVKTYTMAMGLGVLYTLIALGTAAWTSMAG